MKDGVGYQDWLLEPEYDTTEQHRELSLRWKEARVQVEDPTDGQNEEREPASPSSSGDVGFFLSIAGRFPLLDSKREQELAQNLWRARRRIVRALELARRSSRTTRLKVPQVRAHSTRRVSPEVRRRLIAAEDYAERLLQLGQDASFRGERFDRSLSLLPPASARGKHKKRWLGDWTPPSLNRRQLRAIVPILKEELEKIQSVREELAQHNLRLVVWVAKSYRGRGLDLVDLIQEGNIGLLRAIDRFDPAVGTRFSTFATHWVRQGIGRALAERARPIRIPLNRLPEVREAAMMKSELSTKFNRTPSVDEIAKAMRAPRQKVEELLPALTSMVSIDAPIGSGDISQADLLAEKDTPSPLEKAMEGEKTSAVQRVLKLLPDRQRIILAMRYGIGYPRECTLEEIGDALGLSRERIRQIEKVALEGFMSGWNGRGLMA